MCKNQETLRNIASATLDFPAELFEVNKSSNGLIRVFRHCSVL